jgi:hypothetical protein
MQKMPNYFQHQRKEILAPLGPPFYPNVVIIYQDWQSGVLIGSIDLGSVGTNLRAVNRQVSRPTYIVRRSQLLLQLYARATLYAHKTEHGVQETAYTSVQSDQLVTELAIEICRSINYFFLQEHRYMGVLLLCLCPGQVASLSLDRTSELGLWLADILKHGPSWPTHFTI